MSAAATMTCAGVGHGRGRRPGGLAAALAVAAAVLFGAAANGAEDEFFVVSSIDAARGHIVLKRPTETAVTMLVNERTTYRGEQGKPLHLGDLRAGDTAYITSSRSPAGELTALVVRLGPMTVEELQRRYLKPQPQPPPRRGPGPTAKASVPAQAAALPASPA
jgi:hypothetical protein